MAKHIDLVPDLSEFRPPWESADGTVNEVDVEKLKKYVHGLTRDKAKAQDAREEALEKIKSLEAEKGELQSKVNSKDPNLAGQLAAEQDKVKAAEERARKAELSTLRLEVAFEAGLSPKQAKRVQGETQEEIEADVKDLAETFGIKQGSEEESDEQDDLRTQPRVQKNLVNGGDRGSSGVEHVDFDKVAAEIMGSGPFG